MGRRELSRREHTLETAVGFMRTLCRYQEDAHAHTAGDALAAFAERQANGSRAPR